MKHEPSAEVRAFLEQVRDADGPSAARRAHIHRELQGKLAELGVRQIAAPLASTGAGPRLVETLSWSGKWTLLRMATLALVAGGLVAGAWLWRAPNTASLPPEPRAAAPPERPAPLAAGTDAPVRSGAGSGTDKRAHGAQPPAPADDHNEPSAALALTGAAAPEPPERADEAPLSLDARATGRRADPASPRTTQRGVPGRSAPSASSGATAGEASAVPTRPARVSSGRPERSGDRGRGPVEQDPPQTSSTDLAEEVALIHTARQALRRGDLAGATARLSDHAERFAEGRLRQEREGLQLLVRCARGSSPTLRQARDRFLRRTPNSLLAAQIRRACDVDDAQGAR